MAAKKKTKSEEMLKRKQTIKVKVKELKVEKAAALEAKDYEKAALLKKRLHQQRRLIKKLVKKMKAAGAAA